ncbi:hypothetical protein BGZ70_002286, partial [Mortierella alpina]
MKLLINLVTATLLVLAACTAQITEDANDAAQDGFTQLTNGHRVPHRRHHHNKWRHHKHHHHHHQFRKPLPCNEIKLVCENGQVIDNIKCPVSKPLCSESEDVVSALNNVPKKCSKILSVTIIKMPLPCFKKPGQIRADQVDGVDAAEISDAQSDEIDTVTPVNDVSGEGDASDKGGAEDDDENDDGEDDDAVDATWKHKHGHKKHH